MQVIDSMREWAQQRDQAPALSALGAEGELCRTWTWSELGASVRWAAHLLAARFAAGTCIAIQAENSAEQVAWLLGGLSAGLHVLMLHALLTPRETEQLMERSAARALVSAEAPATGPAHLPLALDPGRCTSTPSPMSGADGSIILSSSGTTGLPKLARRDAAALDADGRNVARALGLSRRDRVLAAVPIAHSYGIDLLMASLIAGAAVHLWSGGVEGAALRSHLARGEVTVVPGVPLMFAALTRDTQAPAARGVRLAFSAGTALPPRVAAQVREQWGVTLGHLYGATELGTVAFGHPDDPLFDPQSVGRALDGVEFRIVDPGEPERVLGEGEEGELAVRAPSRLCEYLDGPAPLIDGFLRTGDLARLDAAGRLYLTGRLKHLIDIGGMKVNPAEVEAVFEQHPAIAQCAAVPVAIDDLVTRLRLLYVAHDGQEIDPADLRAFAQRRLAPFKRPRAFQMVAALPRSRAGKLLRDRLVDL